ncbi:MAG: PHP domain-containing protein [Oscillospiraceae bacterium]|nr:PHP domain-containing protein [Oscillospiraceae bacterium]
MSKFILETHAHTHEVSDHAKATGVQVVDRCIRWGYNGVIITDHFNSFKSFGEISWEEKMDRYLSGYRAAKAHAPDGFQVFLGMEISFSCARNDYLVYGFDEDFLYRNSGLVSMEPETFRPFADANGLLFFHAHPFRFGTTIVEPYLLDGIEVHNGSRKYSSDPATANAWADTWGLIKIAGSDYHGSMFNGTSEDIAPGGIGLCWPPDTIGDVVAQLREKKHEVYMGKLGSPNQIR